MIGTIKRYFKRKDGAYSIEFDIDCTHRSAIVYVSDNRTMFPKWWERYYEDEDDDEFDEVWSELEYYHDGITDFLVAIY